MLALVWFGLAHAAQTDCVTKDLTWRWLSTTADSSPAGAKPGDRWVHGSSVIADQGPGASGRVVWRVDEATKVPFRKSQQNGDLIETFKWDVEIKANDGKPLGGDVKETELKLTMHCQRTTTGAGGSAPAPAPAPAKPAPAPAPAPK